jgi:hypothetical protein
MNFLDHETIQKIANAQKQKLEDANNTALSEINYITDSFKNIVTDPSFIENLLKNPFNTYINIPTKNYDPSNKLFIESLKNLYQKTFNHDLQVGKNGYMVLIKSPLFHQQNDPRPTVLEPQKVEVESPSDEAPDLLFTDKEIKRFADREMAPMKKTPNSARSADVVARRDSQLVPMFLQRRLSKTIPPSLDSSREQSLNY